MNSFPAHVQFRQTWRQRVLDELEEHLADGAQTGS